MRFRPRLLLDFGWRFHFGHASHAAKDFRFSNGRSRELQKTGNFLPVAALAFHDSDWQTLDLSFHVGTTTYSGIVGDEHIELRRTGSWHPAAEALQEYPGPKPVIGPPPDGTDPSLAGFHFGGTEPPTLLQRATR